MGNQQDQLNMVALVDSTTIASYQEETAGYAASNKSIVSVMLRQPHITTFVLEDDT